MKSAGSDTMTDVRNELLAWATWVFYGIVKWLFVVPLAFYLYGIPYIQEHLLHIIPEPYRLTFKEALLLSLLLTLVDKVIRIERLVREEIAGATQFWTHPSREKACSHICGIVRRRGATAKHIDLLQFSGDTVVPLLKEIAVSCPEAKVRLFLVPQPVAERYDEPGFHWIRVQHTKGVVKTIEEDHPKFSIEVWSYETEPSVAGIIIDNWLVSVGWYRMFPSDKDSSKLSIRGHASPAFTAIDEHVEPLLQMVRAEFDAVQRKAHLDFSLPAQSKAASQPPS